MLRQRRPAPRVDGTTSPACLCASRGSDRRQRLRRLRRLRERLLAPRLALRVPRSMDADLLGPRDARNDCTRRPGRIRASACAGAHWVPARLPDAVARRAHRHSHAAAVAPFDAPDARARVTDMRKAASVLAMVSLPWIAVACARPSRPRRPDVRRRRSTFENPRGLPRRGRRTEGHRAPRLRSRDFDSPRGRRRSHRQRADKL